MIDNSSPVKVVQCQVQPQLWECGIYHHPIGEQARPGYLTSRSPLAGPFGISPCTTGRVEHDTTGFERSSNAAVSIFPGLPDPGCPHFPPLAGVGTTRQNPGAFAPFPVWPRSCRWAVPPNEDGLVSQCPLSYSCIFLLIFGG